MSLTIYMTSSNLITTYKANFGVLLMYISMDRTGSIIQCLLREFSVVISYFKLFFKKSLRSKSVHGIF
ncbi:hypothetical protein J2W91_005690 [Paenibacillus amylolyticus]|uniref:Uncharacterized protein n=1 Tax=Paenibacillus amylolyticus TaxID=1451 RepID=A0AAP5H6B0_PAEAM|nr:hypothetical protein [Paenibacillus amylolyticus]